MAEHITSFERGANPQASDAVTYLRTFFRRRNEARQAEGPSRGGQQLADFTGSMTERQIHGALFVQAILEFGTRLTRELSLTQVIDPEAAAEHESNSDLIFRNLQNRVEGNDSTDPVAVDPNAVRGGELVVQGLMEQDIPAATIAIDALEALRYEALRSSAAKESGRTAPNAA